MKNGIKELTEGMQRLCAIANRIVAHGDEVSPIERDLLLEDLRRLYEVALGLGDEEKSVRSEVKSPRSEVKMPDDEILSSTVMATMAAMAPAPVVAEEPAPAIETQRAVSPMETENPPVAEETEDAPASEDSIAPDPELVSEPEPEPAPMPAMEDLEGNGNSLLFDEVIIEESAPTAEEMPAASLQVEADNAPASEEEQVTPAEPPKPTAEPGHKAAGTQASLLDYLKRSVEEKPTVRTLGESLGGVESGERRVESVLTKKVSDLRTVININDKFSFMSELFRNNMKAYNDFILRLNAIDTRDEALLCVSEVSAQYHWDESSMAVQAFYKVFDKKF